MSSFAPSPLLRERLLEGVTILLACGECERASVADRHAAATRALCASLGARVEDCRLARHATPEGEEAVHGGAVAAVLEQATTIDMLVLDAAGLFATRGSQATGAGHDARGTLLGVLESCWNITRAVVNQAFLASERAGRIVYLAPAPDAGAHAGAACAGLENLARTLSIEWARHGVTPVTIAPGAHTPSAQVAELTAYLASPAGAYFSGCLLDLRGPG